MVKSRFAWAGAALLAVLALPVLTRAQSTAPAPSEEAQAEELKLAWLAGVRAGTEGPSDVVLIDQATLKLPAGYGFIPSAEGTRILRALGNTVDESTFVGLIVGTRPDDQWMVAARYIKEGYIKDDDAKQWNADELLQDLNPTWPIGPLDRQISRGAAPKRESNQRRPPAKRV